MGNPLQAERDSGGGAKRFAFPPESPLNLRSVDTVLYGTVTEQDDSGFWIVLQKDTLTKIIGQATIPHGESQADVFIPFSSIAWLAVWASTPTP
jgi:hypothetical protein